MKIKTIICGARFGQFYAEALKKSDIFEPVGFFSQGSDYSIKIAKQQGLETYTDIEKLPHDIKLACVILKSGVMGGRGSDISKSLLNKGISVIHEQPIHYKECLECYKSIKGKDVFFSISDFYMNLPIVKKFISKISKICKFEKIEYVNISCANQVIYSAVDLLVKLLGGRVRPWNFENNLQNKNPFVVVSGSMNGVPVNLSIHNEINPDDIDMCFYYLIKCSVGFSSGEITLADIYGPIIWNPKINIKHNFSFKNDILENIDEDIKNRKIVYNAESTEASIKSIFTKEWIEAINESIKIRWLGNCDIKSTANLEGQKMLLNTQIWSDINKCIGYPKENNKLHYSRIPQNIFSDLVQAKVDPNHNKIEYSQKLQLLDAAALYSILYCLQNNGLFEVGKEYEEKDLINGIKSTNNTRHIILRWIKELYKNNYILLKNGLYSTEMETSKYQYEKLWDRAKQYMVPELCNIEVINYYKKNADLLTELLSENKKGTYLLFPQGDISKANVFYRDTFFGKYINNLLAENVLKECIKIKRKINILELGAGTGATTDIILEKIFNANEKIEYEYYYTDISNYFLFSAKARYRNNFTFKLVDIDKDIKEQIGEDIKFDIIIAAGMINNALNTNSSMCFIENILCEKGTLFIAEPVSELKELLISQIFMMTKPIDERQGYNETFLTEYQWKKIISSCGFSNTVVLPLANPGLECFGQKLFIIKKGGKNE